MKQIIYISTLLLLLLSSCVQEDVVVVPEIDDVPEGYTKITFRANIFSPEVVNTRAVDPDGLDVNNMTLFCFNEFGLYISSEEAILTPHSQTNDGISESGVYKAVVPNHTHIIHFLANHSQGLYNEKDFPGQTESMVVANMEGGSGMLVYWSRFQKSAESEQSIDEQLKDLSYVINGTTYKGIKLIRNQAKVTIDNWTTDEFVVTGYRTVNIPAFGTVAPHHPNLKFDLVDKWESTEEFVTLPNNQALMTDISDINTTFKVYVCCITVNSYQFRIIIDIFDVCLVSINCSHRNTVNYKTVNMVVITSCIIVFVTSCCYIKHCVACISEVHVICICVNKYK